MKKSRRNDVIILANKMIRKNGYINLSFTNIAKSLGVTRENVHHYFRKKDRLGDACIEVMIKDLRDVFETIQTIEGSAVIKLKAYFTIYKTQQNDREDCPIVNLLNEYELLPKSMQEGVKELTKIELENLEKILQEGKEQEHFIINTNVKLKAAALIATLKGAVGYTKIYDNFSDMTEYVLKDLKVID